MNTLPALKPKTPAILVGSVKKYRSGIKLGHWIELDGLTDHASFMASARAAHADDPDGPDGFRPMFLRADDLPPGYITESNVSSEVWEWMRLDPTKQEAVDLYRRHHEASATIAECLRAFRGRWQSDIAYAKRYWLDGGLIDRIPSDLRPYIDYAAWLNAEEKRLLRGVTTADGYWAFSSRSMEGKTPAPAHESPEREAVAA